MITAALLGYFLFIRKPAEQEMLAVKAGEFVNQISVSGKVTASQNVDLSFENPGMVRSVYVKVGDAVFAGKLLASQDTGELYARAAQMQAGIDLQKAKLEQALAGASAEDIGVSESAVANAEISVANAQQAVDDAKQNLIDKLEDAYTKTDDAVRYKADQLFNNPQTDSPEFIPSANDSALVSDIEWSRAIIERSIFKVWKPYLDRLTLSSNFTEYGAATRKYIADIKIFLDKLALALNNPNTNYTVSGTIQTMPSTWKSDLSTARTNVNTAIANLSAAEENFKTTVSALKTAEGDLQDAKSQLIFKKAPARPFEVAVYEAQINQARAQLQEVYAQIRKKQVVAPIAGIITAVNAKVGSIAGSDLAISLISSGKFQVESYVPEIYVAQVKVGNDANVTLDSFGTDNIFKAKVVSIEPSQTQKDGVATYKTVLQFVGEAEVKDGMSANVVIITNKKENVISVPQGLVKVKDGKKYVEIKNGDTVENREVVTGDISSSGQVEIVSGLNEGDMLLIN